MKKIDLVKDTIDGDDIQKLISWLQTNPRLTKGELTVQFEKEWSEWLGKKYSVFVNSGSSANLAAIYGLLLSGKLKNNKIVVPAVSWVTTVTPAVQFGMEPIMCECDEENLGLNINHLKQIIEEHNPSCIILVHVLGFPNHMDEILDGAKLPMRYAGYSTCFRREAGSYGKDTRGIIRVHQFDKVEMFSFCKPEEAKEEHKRLLQWEKDFLNAMEIPYRVIDVASGDLGSSANRKFDIEAWIPTQSAYREVTSTSNCTEFQARRLNIRYKDSDGTKAVATLNGTLVAIPRMIVAILENHQNADGSVNVPAALQPFLGTQRFELV